MLRRKGNRAEQEQEGPGPDGEVVATGEQRVQVVLPWPGEVEIVLERAGPRSAQVRLVVPGQGTIEVREGRGRFNVPDGTTLYCGLVDGGSRVRVAWRYETINGVPVAR